MFRVAAVYSLPNIPATAALTRSATLTFYTSATQAVTDTCPQLTIARVRPSRPFTTRAMGSIAANTSIQGDLNNTSSLREVKHIIPDPEYSFRSLAITEDDDDPATRENYRPFLLSPQITANDWISKLELSTATKLAEEDIQKTGERLRVLVLYGSLRQRCVLSRCWIECYVLTDSQVLLEIVGI